MYHCETSTLHTERVRETGDNGNTRSPTGRCLGWNDAETCHKFSLLPEYRKRLVFHENGESSRVTKCRMVRKSSEPAERRRKSVAKKADTKGKTAAGKGKNPVLSKGHPQDVAHPATVEKAESDPETELCVASLNGTANLEPPLTGAVTRRKAKEQACYAEKRQGSDSSVAPGEELDWRPHTAPPRDERASGRRPQHKYIEIHFDMIMRNNATYRIRQLPLGIYYELNSFS
jgi:hypothetical protein